MASSAARPSSPGPSLAAWASPAKTWDKDDAEDEEDEDGRRFVLTSAPLSQALASSLA